MMRVSAVRGVLALVPMLVLCGGRPHAQEAFTPAQRAAIVAIVRDALRSDPSILREAVTALQDDEAHREAGAVRDAVSENHQALVASAGDPVAGDPAGRTTLVEFYDTRCPYCRRMVPVMDALVRAKPNLRVVFKDIPILGPGSVLQAKALLSALALGGDAAYLRMQAAVMADAATPSEATIRADARTAGLDADRVVAGMGGAEVQKRIDANLALAQTMRIEGTPAIVVGAQMIPGAVSLDDLKAAVAKAE